MADIRVVLLYIRFVGKLYLILSFRRAVYPVPGSPIQRHSAVETMTPARRGYEKAFEARNSLRHVSPRLVRRFLVSVFIGSLLTLTYFHTRGITNKVEEGVLRYLSTEEQARLHDHQLQVLQDGLKRCAAINERPVSIADNTRKNPRAVRGAPPILIKNATLIDGDGLTLESQEILLSDGIIVNIGHDLEHPNEAKVIHAGGRYVTPGLVDMVIGP